ncbi:MAG: peptidoglycan DD-metalloendopeptidase family protein [Anaerolineales bacterium]
MAWKSLRPILFGILLLLPLFSVKAQSPSGAATYVVQAGDSLWSIAQRFRVSVTELAAVNNIQDPNQLMAGMELTLPGLEGFSGRLTSLPLSYGEDLQWISRKYQTSIEALMRLNHIVTWNEFYAGASLVLPEERATGNALPCISLPEELSSLEVAILAQTNPWQMAAQNQLTQTVYVLPGEPYLGFADDRSDIAQELACPFSQVNLSPTRFLQGKTAVIRLKGKEERNLQANFMDRTVPFIEEKSGEYVALLGVHAMTEPGLYPLDIYFLSGEKVQYALSQMVNVGRVDYPYDNPLTVDPETIDPSVTEPENELWASYAQAFTPQKYWQGEFVFPSPLSKEYCLTSGDCWSSRFGNRRSYNGGTYDYFHTGLDIVGKEGVEIYAPADGIVVFAGSLTVRGNATMIDHGWGVYTGYYHQKEIYVQVGDRVKAGQLIGLVGSTGRSQGPHLHFEVWVNGVQVDPLDWLTQGFP